MIEVMKYRVESQRRILLTDLLHLVFASGGVTFHSGLNILIYYVVIARNRSTYGKLSSSIPLVCCESWEWLNTRSLGSWNEVQAMQMQLNTQIWDESIRDFGQILQMQNYWAINFCSRHCHQIIIGNFCIRLFSGFQTRTYHYDGLNFSFQS